MHESSLFISKPVLIFSKASMPLLPWKQVLAAKRDCWLNGRFVPWQSMVNHSRL